MKQEIIDYITANPNPDKNMLPLVILETKGNNARYGAYHKYYIPTEGETYIDNTSAFSAIADKTFLRPLSSVGPDTLEYHYLKYYRMFYCKYVPEYQMLELASVELKGTIADKKLMLDKRDWHYCSHLFPQRIFLFVNDITVYGEDGNEIWADKKGKYYNKQLDTLICRLYSTYAHVQRGWFTGMDDNHAIKEFNKFVEACHGDYKATTFWDLKQAYKKLVPRAESKKLIKFAEVLAHPLKDTQEYIQKNMGTDTVTQSKYGYIFHQFKDSNWHLEKIDDDNYVLRNFHLSDDNQSNLESCNKLGVYNIPPELINEECYRIYINRKGEYLIYKQYKGEWVKDTLANLYGRRPTKGIFHNFDTCDFIKDHYDFLLTLQYEMDTSLIKTLLRLQSQKMYKQLQEFKNIFEVYVLQDRRESLMTLAGKTDLYKATTMNKEQLTYIDNMIKYVIPYTSFDLEITPQQLKDYDAHLVEERHRYQHNSYIGDALMTMHMLFGELNSLPIDTFKLYFRRLLSVQSSAYGNWQWRYFGDNNSNESFKAVVETTGTDTEFFKDYLEHSRLYLATKPWGRKSCSEKYSQVKTRADLDKVFPC